MDFLFDQIAIYGGFVGLVAILIALGVFWYVKRACDRITDTHKKMCSGFEKHLETLCNKLDELISEARTQGRETRKAVYDKFKEQNATQNEWRRDNDRDHARLLARLNGGDRR